MADNDNLLELEDDDDDAPNFSNDNGVDVDREPAIFRWMSLIVVLLAVSGFFGLAWYAYKSGGDVVEEKDTEIIQADATPVKEAPANPGGMPIPNQDKSIYNLVGKGKSDNTKVVEHILAAPEKPVARTEPESEAWMSDQVKDKLKANEEQQKAPPMDSAEQTEEQSKETAKPSTDTATQTAAATSTDQQADTVKKAEQFQPTKVHESGSNASAAASMPPTSAQPEKTPAPVQAEVKPAAAQEAIHETEHKEVKKEEPKPEAPKAETAKAETKPETKVETKASAKAVAKEEPVKAAEHVAKVEPPAEKPKPQKAKADESSDTPAPSHKEVAAKPASGGSRAQLGAFKSQAEAEGQWKKIAKKFSDEVGGKDHYVIRADLGEKGVYYRLQLGPFASNKEVEHFCLSLVGDGQGCFPAKGK